MSTPRTYEEERDEAASKISDPYDWILGSDWANERAAKVINELNKKLIIEFHNTEQCEIEVREVQEKLASAYAMIEKLAKVLNSAIPKCYSKSNQECEWAGGTCVHCDRSIERTSREMCDMRPLREALAELEEWRKNGRIF